MPLQIEYYFDFIVRTTFVTEKSRKTRDLCNYKILIFRLYISHEISAKFWS